ncbi:MAG: cupin domain-containing protein [Pseudomonadota bacterium]
MDVTPADRRAAKRGDPAYFTGTVWQDPLQTAPAPAQVRAVCVTFEPGARTAWHTHPRGQTLLVTSGMGRAQSAGGPVRMLRPGDVVWFPPGEKHWHGAAPDSLMTHVAIQEADDSGAHIAWLEPVSDADYLTPPS